MWWLTPVLTLWGSRSHQTRLHSSMLNYNGQKPSVTMQYRRSLYSRSILSKDSKISICQSMQWFCASNKQATVPNLVLHVTLLTNLQNCLRLMEGTHNSDEQWNPRDNRKIQIAAAMYLNADGTSTNPIWGKLDTPKNSTVIFKQHTRNFRGPSTGSQSSHYE